jgi:hypothetical protein
MGRACSTLESHEKCLKHFDKETELLHLLENLGIHGKLILRWILRKQDVRAWTGFVWHMIGSSGGLL